MPKCMNVQKTGRISDTFQNGGFWELLPVLMAPVGEILVREAQFVGRGTNVAIDELCTFLVG